LEKPRNEANIAPKQRKGESCTTAADKRALLGPLCISRLRFRVVLSLGALDLDVLPPALSTGPTGVKFCAVGDDDAGAVTELYRNPIFTRAGAVKISRRRVSSGITMSRRHGSASCGSCSLTPGSTGERRFIKARGSDAEIGLRSESGPSAEGGGVSSQSNASQSDSSATREGLPASYLGKY
jgi:hypothetical protein